MCCGICGWGSLCQRSCRSVSGSTGGTRKQWSINLSVERHPMSFHQNTQNLFLFCLYLIFVSSIQIKIVLIHPKMSQSLILGETGRGTKMKINLMILKKYVESFNKSVTRYVKSIPGTYKLFIATYHTNEC